jgi:hypothetical protein
VSPSDLRLGAPVHAVSAPLSTLRWLSAKDRVLLEIAYPSLWQGQAVRSIHRHQLHEVLLSLVPRESIHLNATVSSVADTDDEAKVAASSVRDLAGALQGHRTDIQAHTRPASSSPRPVKHGPALFHQGFLSADDDPDARTVFVEKRRRLPISAR